MDANIYAYGLDRVGQLSAKALSLINSLQNLKNTHVSVSWHQRVASKDYEWHRFYENMLENCSEYL
jgi:hypothetical protein